MGKRFGGGGRASGAGNRRFLEHRVDECEKKNLTTVDEIVGFLFSEYGRHYARIPERTLRMNVRKILDESRKKSFVFNERDDDDSKEEGGSNKRIRNKRRRLDGAKEEKLQRREESHIKRRNQGRSSSTSSCESFSSEEETDGAVSTSEDAIYSEEVKPEFDLLKSNLNANYAKSNGAVKTPTRRPVEKNIEVDIASNKARSKMAMHTGESSGGSNRLKGSVLASNVACVGGTEVKATEGPRFKDLGGMKGVLDELMMEVIVPLYHPQLPQRLGVKPIGGILFHGPPGCGKTKLAHAIANETGVPFYKISATEVVSGVSGASEENIRELFSKAYRTAPSIVFIDEIDAIASKRENQQREMERRIVTQLMTCMDESHRPVQPSDKNANVDGSESRPGYVLVIGATNRPDALDSALRRPGRFDREINLGVPDENARVEIFSVLTRNLRLEGSFDYAKIARLTPGFVGADLAAVANQAGMLAMKRIVHARKSELSIDSEDEHSWLRQHWSPEDTENLFITMADFEEAVKQVQASSRREGFSTVPNIKWEDVGGLDHLRQEFDRYVIRRVKFPEDYVDFGVDLETGFLLYGPPGCGKTLIAKAVAHEAGANFIHIKGPELLNKYVGESELAVRTLFSRARTCAPCILFFDEVDALTTKRGKEGGWVVERLLNQLLIELDGAEQRRGVFVIGATNRPDVMDPAVLRPGRFGRLLYVPLPSIDERYSILKALARKKPIDAGIDLHAIAKMDSCENFSGADLAAMVNEAAMAALDEKLRTSERCSHPTPMLNPTPTTIRTVHFEQALAKISPSVSIQQKQYYENLSKKLQNGTGRNMDQISKQFMSFLCP